MNKQLKCLYTVFLLLGILSNAFGEDIFMYPLKNNMAGKDLPRKVFREVEQAINNHGMVVVKDKSQSQWVLKGELYRVGKTLSLTLRKFTADGQFDKVTTSNLSMVEEQRPEDLNLVVGELFPGTALPQTDRTFETSSSKHAPSHPRTNKVGRVDPSQIKKMSTRIESKNGTFLGFGPSGTSNQVNGDLTYHVQAGKYYDINPNFTLLLNTDWLANKNTFWGSGAIGMQYFFTDADISPFIGGEFGVGHTNSSETKGVTGFEAGGSLGVKFFRTSTTQLVVAGQYHTILKDNGKGLPHFYGMSVSLYF